MEFDREPQIQDARLQQHAAVSGDGGGDGERLVHDAGWPAEATAAGGKEATGDATAAWHGLLADLAGLQRVQERFLQRERLLVQTNSAQELGLRVAAREVARLALDHREPPHQDAEETRDQ